LLMGMDDIGGPHDSMEDDIHKGYFIPRGMIILTKLC
jgi:hypothetical protein